MEDKLEPTSSVDSAISSKPHSDKLTSMSSFSLGSSFTQEDCQASTSGCSSLEVNRKTALKKQRVKECMQELRSLVKTQRGRARGGTLGTLQQIITHMKRYKEGTSSSAIDPELVSSSTENDNLDLPLTDIALEHVETFSIVTSPEENTVLQVPYKLLRLLQYPHNYWFNQSLLDYVHKRDMTTVSNALSMSRSHPAAQAKGHSDVLFSTEQKNTFFFRLRHYKSISQGYGLSRPDKYTVFSGQTSRKNVSMNLPACSVSPAVPPDQLYPVLKCRPIQSAYTSHQVLPIKRTFLMRHTMHCNYIFMHPSAIPLIGHLPQDIIGTSIFDYYHAHDLVILLGIYKQSKLLQNNQKTSGNYCLIANPGKTFRSVPYRMKVKNGDYIRVETEWSSFLNPWTNRLDFIICKHRILEVPANLDVLSECPSTSRPPPDTCQQARNYQMQIRTLLLQPLLSKPPHKHRRQTLQPSGDGPQPSAPTQHAAIQISPTVATCSGHRLPVEGDNKELNKGDAQEASKQDEQGKDADLHASTKTIGFMESEKLLIYEQLNYAQNIRRFLMSCSLSQQGKDSSSNDDASHNAEDDTTNEEEITVDLSMPKPPSFASSTKALVSEREQLEEMLPSPTHEDMQDDGNTKIQSEDDVYQPVPLTEEVLILHNKLQRQQYIEKMVSEKTSLVSIQGQGVSVVRDTERAKKRLHQQELDCEQNAKVSRYEDQSSNDTSRPTDPAQLLVPPCTDETAGMSPMAGQAAGFESMLQSGPGPSLQPSQGSQGPSSPAYTNFPPTQSQVKHVTAASGTPKSLAVVTTPSFVTMSGLNSMVSSFGFCTNLSQQAASTMVGKRPSGPSLTLPQVNMASQQRPILVQSTTSAGLPQVQGMQWPYLSTPTGISYMPQIVYQPIPGSFFPPIQAQPMLAQPLPTSQLSAAARAPPNSCATKLGNCDLESLSADMDEQKRTKEKQDDEKNLEKAKSSEGSDSQEDTTSSLFYLLENSTSSPSEVEEVQQKWTTPTCAEPHHGDAKVDNPNLCRAPPWRRNMQWSSAVQFSYTMPTKGLEETLKTDAQMLKKMCQPLEVEQQCHELLSFDTGFPSNWLLDDDSLWLMGVQHPDAQPSGLEASPPDDTRDQNGLPPESKTGSVSSATMASNSTSMDEAATAATEGRRKEPKVLSDVDSTDEEEDRSDLTPSEQRSPDEISSSYKESDTSSDNGLGGAQPTAKRSTPLLSKKEVLQRLFIRLEVDQRSTSTPASAVGPSGTAPWLQDVEFDDDMKFNYTSPQNNLKVVLENDEVHLQSMEQPGLVQDQLVELMAQLRQCITQAFAPTNCGEELSDSSPSSCPAAVVSSSSAGGSSDEEQPVSEQQEQERNGAEVDMEQNVQAEGSAVGELDSTEAQDMDHEAAQPGREGQSEHHLQGSLEDTAAAAAATAVEYDCCSPKVLIAQMTSCPPEDVYVGSDQEQDEGNMPLSKAPAASPASQQAMEKEEVEDKEKGEDKEQDLKEMASVLNRLFSTNEELASMGDG